MVCTQSKSSHERMYVVAAIPIDAHAAPSKRHAGTANTTAHEFVSPRATRQPRKTIE